MGNQMTEMLKGTLEGIVLAVLARKSAYGYEITAWLRDRGFSDIAEGTIYALLVRVEQRGFVDVEKVPSEKGPPRKVYSLNASHCRAIAGRKLLHARLVRPPALLVFERARDQLDPSCGHDCSPSSCGCPI